MSVAVQNQRRVQPGDPFAEQRFVIYGVPWESYEALVDALADQRVFLTYNKGTLELMSPSPRHEKIGLLLARFIHAYTEMLRIPLLSLGMTTWKRSDLDKGLEADQCFYVQHEAALRHKDQIDLSIDPPPDLALEVDLSHSSADKEDVYASLGVPELWRFEDEQLTATILEGGRYKKVAKSPAFPQLPVEELTRFLEMRGTMGETELICAFREWVQQNFLRNG